MRKAVLYGAAIVCLCLLFSLSGPSAQRTANGDAGGGAGSSPVAVSVANFPQVQPVQVDKPVTVTGSVAVTNFPAVQQVAGTVSVGDLSVDADGNLKVAGKLLPSAPSIRFVGYTSATFTEGEGLLTLNRACYTEFPGSRTCESAELVHFVPPPPITAAYAMLVMAASTVPAYGTAVVPFSTCMSSGGRPYDCGGAPLPVACCGY